MVQVLDESSHINTKNPGIARFPEITYLNQMDRFWLNRTLCKKTSWDLKFHIFIWTFILYVLILVSRLNRTPRSLLEIRIFIFSLELSSFYMFGFRLVDWIGFQEVFLKSKFSCFHLNFHFTWFDFGWLVLISCYTIFVWPFYGFKRVVSLLI